MKTNEQYIYFCESLYDVSSLIEKAEDQSMPYMTMTDTDYSFIDDFKKERLSVIFSEQLFKTDDLKANVFATQSFNDKFGTNFPVVDIGTGYKL